MQRRLILLLFVTCLCPALRAENWPNWRGPHGNSVAAGSEYPISWSEDSNIQWKVKLPGWGTSTPAIWDDKIFVSCADEEQNKNVLICLDRDGNQLWRTDLGTMVNSKNRKASGANPSPATDGVHVFAYFKSGDLACVDFAGKIVWQTNLQTKYGNDRLNWDLGTSPVITKNAVVVAVMHAGPSYVVALDKKSGEVLWKQDRDLGAPREARDSYSTPLVVTKDDQEYVIVLGADHVNAYLASSGDEAWRVGELNPSRRANFRSIASPSIAGDMILAPYARGRTLTAIRWFEPGTASIEWKNDGSSADVPAPVVFEGKVYLSGDRGDISCVDLQNGDEVWRERLPRNRYVYSSSPVIAAKRLYATREDGTTFVLSLSNPPEIVSTNKLRENTFATPAFVDNKVYLRTSDFLFCIGNEGS